MCSPSIGSPLTRLTSPWRIVLRRQRRNLCAARLALPSVNGARRESVPRYCVRQTRFPLAIPQTTMVACSQTSKFMAPGFLSIRSMASSFVNRAPVTATVPDGLFPLPLEVFEAFNLADDRPDYPKAFVIELQFTGCMDRSALETAMATALAVHPMLRARVETLRRQGDVWVLADQPPHCEWAPAGTPLTEAYRGRLDIRQRPLRPSCGTQAARRSCCFDFTTRAVMASAHSPLSRIF